MSAARRRVTIPEAGHAENRQASAREALSLTRFGDDQRDGSLLEIGYCIDAPDLMPAGAMLALLPRTRDGRPMARAARHVPAPMFTWRIACATAPTTRHSPEARAASATASSR
jgi:hypothetical protein